MSESPETEPMNAEETAAGTDPATAAQPPAQDPAAPKLPPRVAHWCSMLLDLSRRNRLLNFSYEIKISGGIKYIYLISFPFDRDY